MYCHMLCENRNKIYDVMNCVVIYEIRIIQNSLIEIVHNLCL